MKVVVAAVALLALAVAPAGETKLGAGVSLKESTPIKALLDKPQDFVGKTVRVDGVATEICQHMGCWMALAAEDSASGGTVRLKVEDGVIVFPASAKGRKVSAEGVFEVVGKDEESKEAAGEHSKKDAKAQTEYQLKATGAVIQ
jgi:hypothetical protein